jgi:hypothetical protein
MLRPLPPSLPDRGGIRDQSNASLTLNDVVVTNNSATAAVGGVSMENIVDTPWTLTGGVQLMNATGLSQTHINAGDPFIMLPVNQLAAGQSTMVTLMFSANKKVNQVMFNTFVLAGPGVV